jgi:transketolase
MTVDELSRIANRLRLDVVETVHDAGDGHPGPCMSIADIMAVLFFDEMKLDPANPHWPERDRFVLSKGHACPILYAALARKGYFPLEELKGLRSLNSFLQGHPDMNKIPGVDTVSGSLGNGVAIGLGMATGCRMQGIENYVYVIVGDGEEQEGIIWEAAMAAAKFKAGTLIGFADLNNTQSGGKVTEMSSLYPVAD